MNTTIIKLGSQDPEIKKAKKKYKAIIAWHKEAGSYTYYTDMLCLKAMRENAPEYAIYKLDDRKWMTIDDIKNVDILRRMLKMAL